MQDGPSDQFFPNITNAIAMHRKRIVARDERGLQLSVGQSKMLHDLTIFLDALAEGRVTIVPRRE